MGALEGRKEGIGSSHQLRCVRGLFGSARAWYISEILRKHPRLFVICKDRAAADELIQDLSLFVSRSKVLFFGSWETIPFEAVSPQVDISAQRLAALSSIARGIPGVVVTFPEALMQKVVNPNFFEILNVEFKVDENYVREELEKTIRASGYQSVSIVEEVGEVAFHGAVIDIFPAHSSNPIRLEFQGERLSSIRDFDADTQRSINELKSVLITPAREVWDFSRLPHLKEILPEVIDKLKARAKELDTPSRELARALESLEAENQLPGVELLQMLSVPGYVDVFDYLLGNNQFELVVQDVTGLKQALDSYWEIIAEREKLLSSQHYLIPMKEEFYQTPDACLQKLDNFPLWIIDQLDLTESERPQSTIQFRSLGNTELSTKLKSKIGSGEALQPLAQFLKQVRRDGNNVAFVVGSQARATRLQKYLLEINYDSVIFERTASEWLQSSNRYPVVILYGHLTTGFQVPDEYLVFVSEHEIFFEKSYRSKRKAKTSLKRLLGTLAQLETGDYLVHVDYGVGLYQGLKHLEVEGAESDFLDIVYADSRLFLPVHNIGKIQKFVAAEGQTPSLDKLASTRWVKTKQKVRESVATLAGDLIKLYAARSVAKGWRFEPMGAEDENFAEEFAYDETPDQLKAIQYTISDMADEKPMDRLVCGDVGFGKTEVAVRAAYKCLQHARQVAVLVPTTILAEQHKQTFVNRLSNSPFKVAALSRFYSSQQNKETLKALATGDLDVIIGTHRLLSRDIVFKDLGLLIIDEEHRFGVKQKEKLKALKKQVDVLTLTATPIPRTLHMSLLGIRDISVISTPPHDRRLIRTYTAAYDENLMRDAIKRELRRGGQCFVVHNKVQSIPTFAAQLSTLIPEARFQFAHGQMSEHQLENIMQAFLKREVDVLVCTTIIESGIDIPNANTILIDRADQFGLAQLYQLRGRVGRSDRQAYAYFLIPKSHKLSGEAHKRLKALQALDDLGLGFNLALRDMEIRGAGNLLGKEQSGNVLAVGFELYSRILKEAILNLKGEEIDLRETVDPEMKLGISAYIPEHYVPDISERLVLYQRFSAIDTSEETDQLLEEIQDRFGPFDREVRNLAEIMRLRSLLRSHGITKVELTPQKILLSFTPHAPIDVTKVFALVKKAPEKFKFSKNLTLSISLEKSSISSPAALVEPIQSALDEIVRRESL